MRILLAAAALACLGAVPAGAETRIFIIENHSDYGVDQCLTSGARCGKVVASAYCQSRNFAQAVSFRRIEPGRDHRRKRHDPGELPSRHLRRMGRHRVHPLTAGRAPPLRTA